MSTRSLKDFTIPIGMATSDIRTVLSNSFNRPDQRKQTAVYEIIELNQSSSL